jgi:hypothetical protein
MIIKDILHRIGNTARSGPFDGEGVHTILGCPFDLLFNYGGRGAVICFAKKRCENCASFSAAIKGFESAVTPGPVKPQV